VSRQEIVGTKIKWEQSKAHCQEKEPIMSNFARLKEGDGDHDLSDICCMLSGKVFIDPVILSGDGGCSGGE